MVAFKITNLEKAGKRDYRWNLGHRIEYHPSVGIVLSTRPIWCRAARHWTLSRNLARWQRRNALFSLRQFACLLCDSHDIDINMLHSDMDKGKIKSHFTGKAVLKRRSILYLSRVQVATRDIPGDTKEKDRIQQQSKIKVVKMLALVVILFVLSWLPLYAIFTIKKFGMWLSCMFVC